MEEKNPKCGSCNRRIANDAGSAVFKCPGCSKHEIIRCKECRVKAVKYTCPACGFEGPN